MKNLDELRAELSPEAKDLKLNVQAVLRPGNLSKEQAIGTALCCAYYMKDADLIVALREDAEEEAVPAAFLEDAQAAAAIMGMNAVYYRFRHLMAHAADKPRTKYETMQPGLRMNRMAQPKSDKGTFELYSVACAALAGCEMCLTNHETSLLNHGLAEEHVHDAVRIAAAFHGFSVALTL